MHKEYDFISRLDKKYGLFVNLDTALLLFVSNFVEKINQKNMAFKIQSWSHY